MRAITSVSAMCYLASPYGGVGRSSFYIVRHFGQHSLPSTSDDTYELSEEHKQMLSAPYYNQDFSEKDYNALIDALDKNSGECDMDDIDRQLQEVEQEKRLYNSINRMIERSAALEMPKSRVETQAMYPPGRPNDDAANSDTADIILTEEVKHPTDIRHALGPPGSSSSGSITSNHTPRDITDELIERAREAVPPHESLYDDYAPIRLPANANSTSELITGIIQLPDVKDKKELQDSIRIKDYSVDKDTPIDEDVFWLHGINDERAERGEPPLVIPKGQKFDSNPDFVREKRALRLKHISEVRKHCHEARAHREAMKHTFYRKLPRNEMGFAQLTVDDVEKLHYEEVMEELRARGYRTGGGETAARHRLEFAIEEKEQWRFDAIVRQPLEETNENLPEHSREKIADIKKKIKFLEETNMEGDALTGIERLKAKQDILEFHRDPVGYLDLDLLDPSLNPSPEEVEELRNAPVVHDLAFVKAMSDPINRLPDMIPRTFNLQHDVERPYPQYMLHHRHELEALKKEYLSMRRGIHEQTLPEISRRFEVSLHFLGDACCRLGAKPPVPLDLPLRAIISYSAIWDLTEFLNIADTLEIESFYTFMNLEEVAHEFGNTVAEVKEACAKLGIKLPFGNETRLNLHCLLTVEKMLSKPEEDPEIIKLENTPRYKFRDFNDRRPVFPNSLQEPNIREEMAEGEKLLQSDSDDDITIDV
ncbi:hypothetical protein BaOVIS_003290 [Babesia ovis]|uniref:Uncharacterized protein n=1 Tax=Babesia ovis TaxID=5869 RepID=A0A9W5T8S0_BABOV|nr:hypothetical protein BaOVIS_003290 [Babesia ovis]